MTTPIINFAKYIEQKINDTDEKIFSAHFALYIQHDGQENTYPIDFDDVWKWCEYDKKYNAKNVLEKHFIKDKDYIINNKTLLLQDNDNKTSLLQKKEQYNDTRGGQNKEFIMLNIDTFKEFCMKASTPKAKIIRSYYIKLEKIFMSFTKEQLEYSKNQNKALEIAKNKTFKDAYTKQYVVYTMKLQSFENGSYIMKIGKTDDIKYFLQGSDGLFDFASNYEIVDFFNTALKSHNYTDSLNMLLKYIYIIKKLKDNISIVITTIH